MKVHFNKSKSKPILTTQNKNKKVRFVPKKRESTEFIKLIKESIMSKEELNEYYKIPDRLRIRHSLETSKPLKKQRNILRGRLHTYDSKTKRKIHFKISRNKSSEFHEITAEKIHQNLNEDFTLENNEERVNYLMNLNPFYSDYHSIEKHSEYVIRTISPEYKGKIYSGNQVIFRYGAEATDFYIVHKGKVNLYFPFTESLYMNIDEYYIYLLRLRRFGEIEMLNDVLLMNRNAFMKVNDEPFDFDHYILKLYNTYIKIKFSPVFLNQKENKKYNGNSSGYNLNNSKRKIYMSEKEFNDNIYETFTDKEMKNLVLRIENELIETIKYIRPEEIRQIIKEEMEGEMVKKIVKIPEYLIMKLKQFNPDDIKKDAGYISRILPIKIFNTNLPRQKINIMKYLYIKTISVGEYFGGFTNDTNTIFHKKLINIMKHSKLNLKIHQHDYFYNMTAISVRDNNDDYGGYLYLGLIERGLYIQYFRRFIEKINYDKKRFILNNRLFKNCRNENLIKTYSNCFQIKELKENDCLINEKTILTEDNTYIYFIIKGEFHSICNQTLQYIDKILTYLNYEDQIAKTIPIKLNKIKDTFFFEEICKKELKIKLNYLTENDIVGLAENILRDKYFNSVNCISKEGLVYYVDSRIIHIFVESDPNIRENKNLLLYNKYKVLCDALLKQRKIYLDSFCSFQIDSVKERENAISKFIKKRYNVFHAKEKFKKMMEPFTPKYTNLKDRRKKFIKIKPKIYKSLSEVCEVLTKVNKRKTLEEKRNEKALLFKKRYLAENERNKKYRSYEMKEIDMELNLLKEIEFQKSNYVCFKRKSNIDLNSKFKLKNNDNENRKDDLNWVENNNIRKKLKNFTPSAQHRLWKNGNRSSNDIYPFGINDYMSTKNKRNKNNYRIIREKVNQIRLERKEMINQKLRNIYTTDLEKILLSGNFNKLYN